MKIKKTTDKKSKDDNEEEKNSMEDENNEEEEKATNKTEVNPFAVNKRGRLVIEDLPEKESELDQPQEQAAASRTVDLIKQSISTRGAKKKKEDLLNPDQKFLAKLEKRRKPRENKIVFGGSGKNAKLDPYAYIPLDPKRLNKRQRNKESNFQKFERITKKKK